MEGMEKCNNVVIELSPVDDVDEEEIIELPPHEPSVFEQYRKITNEKTRSQVMLLNPPSC